MKLTNNTPSVQESTRKLQGAMSALKLPLIPSSRQISPDYSVPKLHSEKNDVYKFDREISE